MESPLKPEFDYYLANQDEMVAKYNGKFVVIKHQQVIGVFDEPGMAVAEVGKSHRPGSFLVQRVTPGDSAYSQTFHSRVLFSSLA